VPEFLPKELLLKLIEATPEKIAEVEHLLMLSPHVAPNAKNGMGEIYGMFRELHREIASLRQMLTVIHSPTTPAAMGGTRSFTRRGDFWKVIFDGHELHVAHSLGARYLNYLLHHPNQPISAFELETIVAPEKASARAVNSFTDATDSEALRQSLRELERLRAERDEAEQGGHYGKAAELDGDIETLEARLNQGPRSRDTGERARDNVRKAIGKVLCRLRRGDAAQKAFGAHVGQFVNTGYTCMYQQPPGGEWS